MPATTSSLNLAQVKELYARAVAKMDEGQIEQAIPLLGQIVDLYPNIAEAHWQLARIFNDVGKLDRASEHAAAAVRLKPNEPLVWGTWADTVTLSDNKQAEQAFLGELKAADLPGGVRIRLQDRFGAQRRASRPDTQGLDTKSLNRAAELIAKGDLQTAQSVVARLLRERPQSALLHNMAGSILSALGQGPQALAAFRAARKLDPFYAEVWLNEAKELQKQGKVSGALNAFRASIARAPDNEQALIGYTTLLNQQAQPKHATVYAERLLRLYSSSPQALVAAANTLMLLRDYVRASAALEKAVALTKRASVEALLLLAQSYTHVNRDADAVRLIEEVLAIRPDNVTALTKKASLLQSMGDFEEADRVFRHALALAPHDGELFRSFIVSHKVKVGDPIIEQMQAAMASSDLTDRSRLSFAFAIGKALEDQKKYEDAFSFFREGNNLVRKLHPYDIVSRYSEVAAVQNAMRGFDWKGAHIPDTSQAAPIFITGMPRSGTTLVEQIIASHSRVTGAGELALLQASCQKLLMLQSERPGETRSLHHVPSLEISDMGQAFIRELNNRFPGSDIVTDKSITTYMYIGLVKLALPNARIIAVRRDPRDTLLSIYKNRFPEGTHLYAYDLKDLAHFYGTFVEMLDFWRQETPDWFTEVEYEAIVANPEEESRRLIAACGLEWEHSCLSFYENKRKVDTLSVYQVRQPISRSSVAAWQRHEAELEPMIEVLKQRGLLPS